MIGLLIKDIYNIRKQALWYLATIIIFAFLSIVLKNGGFIASIGMVTAVNVPLTAIAYEKREGWQKFIVASGIKISNIVIEKYIMGLIFSFVSTIALLIFFLMTEVVSNSWLEFTISVCMQLLTLSIAMPITFKFGVEKSRSYLMVAVFAIMVVFVALMTLFDKVLSTIVINVSLISSLLIIMSLIILGVSYYISIKIYQKKEF